MDRSRPWKWEFERSHWDSKSDANTFSIGIFQWLPKAAAKGLKKSKTLRVSGYTDARGASGRIWAASLAVAANPRVIGRIQG
jgi:hypothetical protein